MQVWYINLKRRNDRRFSIYNNFVKKHVPGDKIKRFDATDRDAFDDIQSLISFAVTDFPEFENTRKHEGIWMYLGYMHSYLSALRDIRDQDETVLLMEDDYHLNEKYSTLLMSFEQLPKPVKFAMIGYNVHSEDFIELPDYDETWRIGAPANGNSANIYTPQGAGFVLDACLAKMDTTPECVIQQLKSEGIYSRHPDKMGIISSPKMGRSDVFEGKFING